MRPRKRTDTIIRQYRYSVSTDLRPLPEEVWDIARRMQSAWNALIVAYADSSLAAFNHLYAGAKASFRETKDEAAYKATIVGLNAKKREIWLVWDKTAKQTIAPFCLNYSQAPTIIARFNGCIKAGRTCFPETKLEHIQLPFVFSGSAAIPVTKLFNNTKRWRVLIEGYNDDMYATNTRACRRERRMLYLELGLSPFVAIPLRLDLHRQLPKTGFVKLISLCGRKLPFRGWRWHVIFQVEMPISQLSPRRQSSVSVRICWTRVDDSIVVAQWKDTADRQGILCLPLTAANHQDRRTAKRRPEWSDWLMSYRDLAAYRTTEFTLPQGSEARMKRRERRRRVEERWQAKRRWLYYNFAAWLVREFAVIRLPNLDVKSIAEDKKKTWSLIGGSHWRQVAAPGDLLTIITETAQKHGRTIESFSQTSMDFQQLTGDGIDLRTLAEHHSIEVFDVLWNSKAVAGVVHAR